MTDPVIKITNPYGIPQDIRDSARAQGEDNPLDIRKDGMMGMLLKVLGLPGIATGMRVPRAKAPPMLPSQPGVMPELMGMENFNKIRPGHKGLDVPGNRNTPQYQGPMHSLPDNLEFNRAINKIDENLFRNTGQSDWGKTKLQLLQEGVDKLPPMARDLENMPGVFNAKEPLGSVQPVDPLVQILMGKNEGKGNFGTTDAMKMRLPANDMPEARMNLSGAEKFELAKQQQDLKKMGYTQTQIDNMSPMEMLQKLFPRLFDD